MTCTSLFLLFSNSLFLSFTPWNSHLRQFALSSMSGTQLGRQGEEGEKRKRGECYSKSPAQNNPRRLKKGRKGKCGWEGQTVWETKKTEQWLLTERKTYFCCKRQTHRQLEWQKACRQRLNDLNRIMSVYGHLTCASLRSFMTKWAQSQILRW